MHVISEVRPLLLASASPRRREILTNLRIPTVVAPVDVDESKAPGEAGDAYLERIVGAKLDAASVHFASVDIGDTMPGASATRLAAAVLVADTVVVDGGYILGKPTSRLDAEAMIGRLAGKTHEVWTRFAIGTPDMRTLVLHAETVRTHVTFRPLSVARVRSYVLSGEGDDKAGSYAIQGLGAGLVARVEGSYSNVVGLPACEVLVALEALGLVP